jgi:hypothetical protein
VVVHIVFPPVALRSNTAHDLLILEVSRSHTTTHHSRQDSSGRVISPSQRPVPNNTQHSTQTDIHASGGIRTHNPSKRATAEPRLRPRGHWYRLPNIIRVFELRQTSLMSLAFLFHYLMLNMFRMLIHPSPGACDLFVELVNGMCCSWNNSTNKSQAP